MTVEVLAIIDNPEVSERIETIFEFLDHKLFLASGLTSLSRAGAAQHSFLMGLICLDDEVQLEAAAAYLYRRFPSLPVYVLRDAGDIGRHVLCKGVAGELEYPILHRQLMGTLRRAQVARNGRRSKGLSSTLTGSSPALREVQSLVRHVSATDANVLLLGESGTGKEVVARGIHNLSLRAREPFVAVNCGAIPADLLESELFGHEKGAFTGAVSARRGRFELAEGGTLFLDEIGDMPMPMQVKLLRVIQQRTYERVGGKTMRSNVRLIAATHQNLERQISEGRFRMDLFYRLNVFPIELPPLRDRPEDIPALVEEFASRMELDHGTPIEFDPGALEALARHPLPGNVRELENLVERLAILFPGETITAAKLPKRYQIPDEQPAMPEAAALQAQPGPTAATVTAAQSPEIPLPEEVLAPFAGRQSTLDLKEYLGNLEKSIIEQTLEKSNWIVAKAAKALSLQRTTLVEKIKKYEIHNSI